MHKTHYPEGTDDLLKKYNLTREQVTPVAFQKGETILEQGYPINALFFVISGTCRIQTYSSDGKILSFGNAGAGSALGEMELLLGQEDSCNTVLVLTKMICLMLPLSTAKRLIRTNATLAYQLGHDAAMLWWYRNNNYVSALSTDAMTRLCFYLLQNENEGIISSPLTDITYAVSISYRHLLRLMNSLVSDGIITKTGKHYTISERDRLISMAQI